jgi:hypothetical protein
MGSRKPVGDVSETGSILLGELVQVLQNETHAVSRLNGVDPLAAVPITRTQRVNVLVGSGKRLNLLELHCE